jgi:hypothetical protein
MEKHETGNEQSFDAVAKAPITAAAKVIRFSDFDYIGNNNRPLTNFSNTAVLLIRPDAGAAELIFSTTTTDRGWRGDVWITVFLKTGGISFAQYSLPVLHAFCGRQDVLLKTGIDGGHVDIADNASLNVNGPRWLRC